MAPVTLSLFLEFLLYIYQVASQRQAASIASTLKSIQGVVTWVQLYPDWFFPLLGASIVATLIGLSVSFLWYIANSYTPSNPVLSTILSKISSIRPLLKVALLEAYSAATLVSIYAIWKGGILARYHGVSVLGLGEGAHYYSILIVLVAGVCGFVLYRGSVLRAAIFPGVAYSIHEALFNAFFLTYNLKVLGFGSSLWWILLILQALVVVVSLAVGLLRRSKAGLYAFAALVGVTLIWAALGFPVTADFFESASLNALNNPNPVANLFEAAWNVVSLTFIVLVYKWRGSLSVSLR